MFCISRFQLFMEAILCSHPRLAPFYQTEVVLCIIFPEFSLACLVSLETLGSPLEFEIQFYGFEQSLAAEHEFIMTDRLTICHPDYTWNQLVNWPLNVIVLRKGDGCCHMNWTTNFKNLNIVKVDFTVNGLKVLLLFSPPLPKKYDFQNVLKNWKKTKKHDEHLGHFMCHKSETSEKV